MKLTIIIALALMTFFVGCNKGQLTKKMADTALYKWQMLAEGVTPNRGGSGTAASTPQPTMVIESIQELPQENSAKVNIKFNNWEYGSGKFNYSPYAFDRQKPNISRFLLAFNRKM